MSKIKLSALFCAMMILVGCKDEVVQKQTPTLPVGMMVAQMKDVPIKMSFSAQIVSELDVVVRAKVTGTIEEQFFKAGQSVKKGDKLYAIDKAKYKAAYDVAAANLRATQASYKNAEADYKRSLNLFKKKALSQSEFDAATAKYESARANVAQAKASLTNAEIDLSYAEVTAPFDGVVADTQKSVGSYVSPSDGALVRLTQLDPIYAKFAISDTQKLTIDENMQNGAWEQLNSLVTLKIGNQEFNGTLEFIDNVFDEKSATAAAKAKFNNPNFVLRTGSFAVVTTHGFVQKNGFEIPQIAILQDISNPYVYVINKERKIEKRVIKIAAQDAINAVVSQGLNDGDMIVMDNFKKIRVGQQVNPVPFEMSAQDLAKMAKEKAEKEKTEAK